MDAAAKEYQQKWQGRALYLVVLGFFVFSILIVVNVWKHPAYPVNDLTAPLFSSHEFAEGRNPYGATKELEAAWTAECTRYRNDCDTYAGVLVDRPMAYPPQTLLMLSPLSFLGYHFASRIYQILTLGFLTFVVVYLASKLAWSWRDPRKLFFVVFSLGIAPFFYGAKQLNLSTLLVACLCLGAAVFEKRPKLAGVLFAVAFCIKPQMGILFILYPLLRGRWKTTLTALGVSAGAGLACVAWLWAHHVVWLPSFLDQARQTMSSSGINGYTDGDYPVFYMVNLQVLVYQFLPSVAGSRVVALAIFAVLALLAAWVIRRRVNEQNEFAGFALVAILTMLPFYHRYYGVEILILVFYWAVAQWEMKWAFWVRILMLQLLMPLNWWMDRGMRYPQMLFKFTSDYKGLIFEDFSNWFESLHLNASFVGRAILLPHTIWMELILWGIVLWALRAKDAPTVRPTQAEG